jgi:RND family efflux transporter MFP subunit
MNPIRLALMFSILAGFGAVGGCTKPGPAASSAASDVDYYTCTMHPSVHSQDADGKCPICGMDLVPVKKRDAQAATAGEGVTAMKARGPADQPHEFTIPLDRQQMIGVAFATAEKRPLKRTLRTVGLVATTTANQWDYVARVDGYVHDLNVSSSGDKVVKGQILMDLYSPDLVATENEFIDLLRMRDNGRRDNNPSTTENAERLIAGSRARLRQWNISDAQVDAMERTGKAEQYLELNSPFAGVVEEVAVHQGRHVAVGDNLIDIVDLSSVWVWAEFYENELPLLKTGLAVTITSSSLPGLSIPGRIAAIDPVLNDAKRTGRVRIDVDNADMKLRPEAYVDVTLTLDEGEGLTVPFDAVLPTGEHNIVFVDKGAGRLEPRYIQLGAQYGDSYHVTGGLRAGDRVVSSANFLIDAEAKVQGALKSW